MAPEDSTLLWKALATCYNLGGAYEADARSIITCLDYKQPNHFAFSPDHSDFFHPTSIASIADPTHAEDLKLTTSLDITANVITWLIISSTNSFQAQDR